jgi:hypothetical protein
MTEPGNDSLQPGAVAGRAAWWLGVGDLRRCLPETSTVARASGTQGGGCLRRRRWLGFGRWPGGKDDGRAVAGCERVGAALADLGQGVGCAQI